MNVVTLRVLRRAKAVLFALVLLTASATCVGAQQSAQDSVTSRGPYTRHPEAVKAIAQLKSPYCPGLMLEVCTSAPGHALRDSIEVLADAGWKSDSIIAWVLANHGERWLAMPPREGKALIAWIVPPVVVLIGLGMVLVALRQLRKGRPEPAPARDLSPEEENQLREALRELEAEEDVPLI